ncbi:zinc-dependent alcohol dehydrogenase family protein [Paraburkholderia saeva]|uniref:zinc-dependent alcohol dehydrogenase family protein n=1 Tax=Paraburkholderia saeva TaxID=2777537 RepID=UPI001DCB17E9|nr:zinc-dependent alcohol dehydrogenase family protein [Paraburkholderia saeva]CAG4927998.1 2-haloacrylate reductase [Paraburkholderia saeva]CAG4928244.1 2-haloacrylate reductase [Paraburkholderia saeva]
MTRSIRIHEFGNPDVLQIEDVAVGEPRAGEVRLRIHAIGLNRTELTLRSGRAPVKPALPSGIGFEAAGVIEALGPEVTGFAVGDRVALVPAYGAAQYSLYGEVSLAPARSLVAIPEHVSFVEAAATWAAYGTAWAGLVAVGRLAAGQTLLISAASSSVGLAAIQIANRVGARPLALTRSRAKADALLRHGAAAVVATGEQDVVAQVKRLTDGKGAELVFDPVGGPGFADLARATANGGTLVLYGALATDLTVIPPFDILARDLTVRGLALTARTRDDAQLAALKRFVSEGLADGTLCPAIDRTFPFDEIAAAHRFIEAGEQVGKIVVTV